MYRWALGGRSGRYSVLFAWVFEMQMKMEWISGTAYLLGGWITKTSDSRNGAQIPPYKIPGRKFMQGLLIVLTMYSVFLDTNIP